MYRVSKKIIFKLIFEFLSLGGVFLGVKNNLRALGTKQAENSLQLQSSYNGSHVLCLTIMD